jgi:hypothetical protein
VVTRPLSRCLQFSWSKRAPFAHDLRSSSSFSASNRLFHAVNTPHLDNGNYKPSTPTLYNENEHTAVTGSVQPGANSPATIPHPSNTKPSRATDEQSWPEYVDLFCLRTTANTIQGTCFTSYCAWLGFASLGWQLSTLPSDSLRFGCEVGEWAWHGANSGFSRAS